MWKHDNFINLQLHAPSIATLIIRFDSHITKVIGKFSANGFKDVEWTTSNEQNVVYPIETKPTTFEVTLETGYVLDDVSLDDLTSGFMLQDKTDNTFIIAWEYFAEGTITLTSKVGGGGSMTKQVDLTTLTGWANLSDGEHQVTIVAKGTGYRDSNPSTPVAITKGAVAGNTLTVKSEHITARVNGVAVTKNNSPYKLTADCTIAVKDEYNVSWSSYIINNKYYNGGSINIAAQDIVIKGGSPLKTGYTAPTVTINYKVEAAEAFTQIDVAVVPKRQYGVSNRASNAPRCRISNMKQSKIYSVFFSNVYDSSGGTPSSLAYFRWENNTWKHEGASINYDHITSSSVDLYNFAGGSTLLNNIIVLEGDTKAIASDFAGFAASQSLPYYICIKEGTLITLADRTKKPIEDITYDDELLVWNFYKGKFDTAKPCWITKEQTAHEYNLCKFSNGAEVGFVGQGANIGYHRIYNDEAKAFTHTGVAETPIGTHTFDEYCNTPQLISQQVVTEPVKYYNVGTTKHINLFANGILTSSRISNKYAIENMRYVGPQLISDEEEQLYILEKLKRS